MRFIGVLLALVPGCSSTDIGGPCSATAPCGDGAVCDFTDPAGPSCVSADGDDDGDGIVSAPEPVRVTVSGRFSVSSSVTFFESDDSPAAAELRMGAWESGVGPGGRVVVRGTSCFTPSSCTSELAAIAGLQPGDELLIDGSTKPLPPDCVVTSTELTNEQGGSSWVDPDPQSIDARLIHWSTGSASIPFGGATNGNDVDNEQVAFVPLQNNDGTGGRPPSTVSVSVVKCAETDYDDLRPLLAP